MVHMSGLHRENTTTFKHSTLSVCLSRFDLRAMVLPAGYKYDPEPP